MKILICGASGFVGRHIYDALTAAGHDCVRGVRRPRAANDIAVDYLKDLTPETWLPKLAGIDAVINAVGVLRDTKAQPMRQLLAEAPSALFRACAQAGVKRIVNFSALGIESSLDVPYFARRREAEAVLFASPPDVRWLNLRPSVIYGDDGASARMFRMLASLPVHGLPMGGEQQLQPVHIDDVCEAVRNWLAEPDASNTSVNAAGPEVVTMRGMLDSYRQQLGRGNALHVHVPGMFVKLGARLGDFVPASPLCSDTWTMLNAGNTGDNTGFARLLGREPLHYSRFIAKE
ncbi:MAG: NAD(P)H-binding protein [Pseudomonadota bacterium]|nr:NAD(P)H-binding protein [Pseudomonadota bacterium]